MKIAIYTIAKNEEKFAENFMQTCKPADLIVVGDGGSTDRTKEIIQDMGGHVIDLSINPWRFDMGRNTVMTVLPADIDFGFAMDLDECFQATNWRDILEQSWVVGEHTRLRFRYIHSFKANGDPGTVGMKDFAHERHNYFWQHAVHETLYYRGNAKENMLTLPELVVEHRQDKDKSRASYVPLLEQECASLTCSPRHIFWLLREYVTLKQWAKVVECADKFLDKDGTWYVERSHALRYRAKALSYLDKPADALADHFRSVEVAPKEREGWMDMAWYHHARQQWPQAYGAVCQAMTISTRPEHYLANEEAWGFKIHELATICTVKMGMISKAKEHIEVAIRLGYGAPHLERMKAQLHGAK